MKRISSPRNMTAGALAMAGLLLIAAAPAAQGGNGNNGNGRSPVDRFDGSTADAWFVQVDDVDGPNGNYHEGYLFAYGTSASTADVFVDIWDWSCEEGRTPYDDWFFEDEEPEGEWEPGCEMVGSRFGEGFDLAWSAEGRLESASVAGDVQMYDWETGEYGDSFAVDVQFTGVGRIATGMYSYSYSYNDGEFSDMFRERSQNREASVTGTIAELDLSDADESGGYLTKFRAQSKFRFNDRGR